MDEIETATEDLFKLLDEFCKRLAGRGLTREQVTAVLSALDLYAIKDTVALAFGDD